MSSNINPYNIDGTFPVAGQDNPSQGFRDNFTNIKNNFVFAQSEINDLQGKAILTGALAGASLNNDMAGTPITRPQLVAWTESFLDLGGISTTAILDFNSGNFQRLTTAAPIAITFQNWPLSVGAGSLGYGVMRVWIAVTNIAHTVTLDAKVTIGVADIAGYNYANNTITFNKVGNYVFDFSSVDGGYNYLICDVTRNRSTFQDASFFYDSTVSGAVMVGYDSGLNTAITSDNGLYNVSGYGGYNSFGNAQVAGPLAGYTVTSARGNLLAASIQPVRSGDQLGYVNAMTFTGNGAGNVMQQVASINFYAKGTQVANGLGGNIAFFTADDGGANPNAVSQALGLENDQSAKFYGNVNISGTVTHNAGFVDTGYQYAAPTTGFATTISTGKSRLILDPAGTLATGNVILPNVAVDGTIISVHSTATITTFGANSLQSGTVVKPADAITLSAGTGVDYFYHQTENTWYKIR